MTTMIRGKSGKESLRKLLTLHDELTILIESAKKMEEPLVVKASNKEELSIEITKEELILILQARLQVINTKLENLGLKIGDDIDPPSKD